MNAVSPMMTFDVKRSPFIRPRFPKTLEFPIMFPVCEANMLLMLRFPFTERFPVTVELPMMFPVRDPNRLLAYMLLDTVRFPKRFEFPMMFPVRDPNTLVENIF